MNPEDLSSKLRGLSRSIADARVIYAAVGTTMEEMSERIWTRGELSGGGTITYNEDYPVWISVPPFPRKGSGRGKPGKKGKTRKVKGGWAPTYLKAKEQVGRGNMPFELSGALRTAWLGGLTPISDTECAIDLKSQDEAKKVEGLTAEKGAFLDLTKEEQKKHQENGLTAYKELVLKQW